MCTYCELAARYAYVFLTMFRGIVKNALRFYAIPTLSLIKFIPILGFMHTKNNMCSCNRRGFRHVQVE